MLQTIVVVSQSHLQILLWRTKHEKIYTKIGLHSKPEGPYFIKIQVPNDIKCFFFPPMSTFKASTIFVPSTIRRLCPVAFKTIILVLPFRVCDWM